MTKIVKSNLFKIICFVLVVSFITSDISWAYPVTPSEPSTLGAQAIFQQQMMTAQAEELRKLVVSDESLAATVISTAKLLLDDKCELKRLENTLTLEFASTGARLAEGIDLAQIQKDSDTLLIPYKKGDKACYILVTPKANINENERFGYEWPISDRYAVTVVPVNYKGETAVAVQETKVKTTPAAGAVSEESGSQGIEQIVGIKGPEVDSRGAMISSSAAAKKVILTVLFLVAFFVFKARPDELGAEAIQMNGSIVGFIRNYPVPVMSFAICATYFIGAIMVISLEHRSSGMPLESTNEKANVKDKIRNSIIKSVIASVVSFFVVGLLGSAAIYYMDEAARRNGIGATETDASLNIWLIASIAGLLLPQIHSAAKTISRLLVGSEAKQGYGYYSRGRKFYTLPELVIAGAIALASASFFLLGIDEGYKIAGLVLLGVFAATLIWRPAGDFGDKIGSAAQASWARWTNWVRGLGRIKVVRILEKASEGKTSIWLPVGSEAASSGAIGTEVVEEGWINKEQLLEYILEILKFIRPARPEKKLKLVMDFMPAGRLPNLRKALESIKPFIGVKFEMFKDIKYAQKDYGITDNELEIIRLILERPEPVKKDIIAIKEPRVNIVPGSVPEVVGAQSAKTAEVEAKIEQLFVTVNDRLNNRRSQAIQGANSVLTQLAERKLLPAGVSTRKIDRTDSAAGVKVHVMNAIQVAEQVDVMGKLPDDIKQIVADIKDDVKHIEADTFVAGAIVLARKAKRDGERLIIGLETDWIPGYNDDHSMMYNAMNPLITEIESLGKVFRSMNLNVSIIHKPIDELAAAVTKEADKYNGGKLRSVVILCSAEYLDSKYLDALRSKPQDKRAFLAGVDPSEARQVLLENPGTTKELDITIMPILTTAVEYAIKSSAWNRIMTFKLPRPKLIDYKTLRDNCLGELKALQAA